MATYVILSRFSPEAFGDPTELKQLAAAVAEKIKTECPGVVWKESFATLGRFDVVDIVQAADPREVEKAVMIIRAYGHSTTETLVATPWKEFLDMLETRALLFMISPGVSRPPRRGYTGGPLKGKLDVLALVEVADANLLDQFVLGRITNAPDDQATQAHIVLPYLDGAALGGGMKAGVTLGVIVAILSPVIGNLYQYYSVTYLPVGLAFTDSIFHLIAHAIEGGVAGLIYKDIGRL